MSMSSSGVVCDVCEKYVLLESFHNFSIPGIDQMLQCHDSCKPILLEVVEKKDWTLLPEGPIRRCFRDHYKPSDAKINPLDEEGEK